MIALISTILEAAITIFGFFTKRSQRREDLKEIMDEFSKKHDSEVRKNIELRSQYEELKKKMREKIDAGSSSPPRD